mgnify:FL=1|jgi:hypothetical protein
MMGTFNHSKNKDDKQKPHTGGSLIPTGMGSLFNEKCVLGNCPIYSTENSPLLRISSEEAPTRTSNFPGSTVHSM